MLARIRSNLLNSALSIVLIAAIGGTAIAIAGGSAQVSQSTGEVLACAVKKGKKKGQLRLVTKAKCKKSERLVRWNTAGPAGQNGASGQRGPTGPTGADTTAPAGAVMAFDLASCPSGWTTYTPAQGRYIVGLPAGGTLAGTAGTALSDLENRATGQHDHAVTDPGHAHAIDANSILTGGNVTARRVQGTNSLNNSTTTELAGAAKTAPTGITVNPAGAVAGTNAPYVQLLVCEKG